jgi:hypothetical protein
LAAAAARPGKFLGQTLGQPKAGTVSNMHAGERRENPLLTERVPGMQLGKGGLPQVLQKRDGARRHPLLQCFGGDGHGIVELCGFCCQLRDGRFRRPPPPQRHQGEKEFAGDLGRALDKLRAPAAPTGTISGGG